MRFMRLVLVAAVCALSGAVVGCAVAERLFGITTDPVTGQKKSDGTGGAAGSLIGIFAPWATALVAGGAGIYANAKRAGWKQTAISTMQVIEAWKSTPDGAEVWADLKAKFGEAHAGAHVLKYVEAALGNLKPAGAPGAPPLVTR